MPKTSDVPQNMRNFNKLFESFAYKHDYDRVFIDFLDLTIKGLSPWEKFEQLNKDIQNRYKQKERVVFGEMINEFLLIQKKQIVSDTDWHDSLGIFYEILASSGKRSSLGQFFTPEHIVELMIRMQGDNIGNGKLINDPCCGSGRFLIGFHATNPGNYYIAQDIDPVCIKMTAVNMCIHGAVGVIIHHNSLLPNSFFNAYAINEILNQKGIPTIRSISKEEVNLFYHMHKPKQLEEKIKVIKKSEEIIENRDVSFPESEGVQQLTLF